MTTAQFVPKTRDVPRPASAASRWLGRCSGGAVSLVLHGALVLAAILSATGPRSGRGGGVVGGIGGSASEVHDVVFHTSGEDRMEAAPRDPDARAFGEPATDDAAVTEAPELPSQDFLTELPGETAAARPPASDAATSRSRSTAAYEKLPPAPGSSGDGAEQPGNSAIGGTGGNTGGAGDGTEGALYMPRPDYPPSARRKNVEGVVVVAVEVHADGHCEGALVIASSGSDALDNAALGAIRKWRYEPRAGGAPEIRHVRFVFKLQ